MKKRKTWIVVLLIVALIAAAIVYRAGTMPDPTEMSQNTQSYTVGRGDVSVTITGSGKLEAQDSVDVHLPVEVKVDTLFAEAGDIVAQGDVLASLNAESLQNRAAELSAELSQLDRELGSFKTTGTIKSPVSGRIKYQPAAEDDDVIESVNEYGALAILSTDGLMRIQLQTKQSLSLNAEVSVRWNGNAQDGKVASRTDGGYLITLDDAKAPYLDTADVFVDGAKIGSGVIEINAPLAIFGNGGTVSTIHYKVNSSVTPNATLFTLDNEPATDTYRQTLAKRNDKAQQLQTILQYQKAPNVMAPAAGTVNTVAISEGKKTVAEVADGSGEMTAFVLGTGGAVKMTVDVDELDIVKVQVGQVAKLTLDAFSTDEFSGEVTRISHIGMPSGSITVYETDLLLDYDERLMAGMNGTSVIQSDRVEDVVRIPMGAIHEDEEGAFVYRLDESGASIRASIKTGLSDGSYAQVLSGLQEGDKIAYVNPATVETFVFPVPGRSPFGGQ